MNDMQLQKQSIICIHEILLKWDSVTGCSLQRTSQPQMTSSSVGIRNDSRVPEIPV